MREFSIDFCFNELWNFKLVSFLDISFLIFWFRLSLKKHFHEIFIYYFVFTTQTWDFPDDHQTSWPFDVVVYVIKQKTKQVH